MQIVGKGIYSTRDARRLTGIPSVSMRRWLFGYDYHRKAMRHHIDPVIDADYTGDNDFFNLSFLDLIQIRFVNAFRQLGVSLQSIRIASTRAAEMLAAKHPFATHKFYTDGRTILVRIAQESGEPDLLDLVRRQYVMNRMLRGKLYEGIEFGDMETPERWWPRGFDVPVVVDPTRSFGKPVVASASVPTELLFKMFMAEGSAETVASWYETSIEEVRAAIQFERSLAA